MITLVLYPELKGLWLGEDCDRWTLHDCSAIGVKVVDASGAIAEGVLTVGGQSFETVGGRANVLTEELNQYGSNSVGFTASDGIVYPCTPILAREEKWYFPSPAESLEDREVIALLETLRMTRARLEQEETVKATAVSPLLGI